MDFKRKIDRSRGDFKWNHRKARAYADCLVRMRDMYPYKDINLLSLHHLGLAVGTAKFHWLQFDYLC